VLLQIGDQGPGIGRVLAQLGDQLVEGLLLALQPLDPDDQIAERQQVATQAGPVVARIRGIDLEPLQRR
jgi:hypothetical protein